MIALAGLASAEPFQPATADCNPPNGWETVADAAEGRVLFVGETHGNVETPDAFYRYVCAASSMQGRTLVLLELPPTHETAIQQASASADARASLLSGMEAHWKTQDGRGSAAMLDLLERLVWLEQANDRVMIEPFSQFLLKEFPTPEETMEWVASLTPTGIQEQIEAGMAQEIRRRSEGYDRTIVLVGNVHASQASIGGTGVSSAAMRVPGSVSLRVVHDGGESWFHSEGSSGTHTVPQQNPNREPENSMALNDMYAPHFHGFLSVGPISASPPALIEAQ